jgi:uncharacterized protein (DUF433 family)
MSVIIKDKHILGGTPVFAGTRVPVRNLFDYLLSGESIKTFLDDFPTVSFEQVRQVLQNSEVFIEQQAA